MADKTEHRRGPDRRRQPRGGRRAEDGAGFAPLVLLIGDNATTVEQSEAVLARLHFGVTISDTVDDALRVVAGLRPDVIVATAADAPRIRLEAPEHLPVLIMTDEMHADQEALIEGIRNVLRGAQGRFAP